MNANDVYSRILTDALRPIFHATISDEEIAKAERLIKSLVSSGLPEDDIHRAVRALFGFDG